MKKKLMSVLLAAAMVASMAVGCGSDKKASSDSGDTKKTESTEKKTESNQILFNGSSTLAPVITSIATDFFDTYGTWDAYDSSLPKEDIAIYVSAGGSGQGTKAVIDGTSTFGMVARSVKDEEKEAELILYDNNGKIIDSTQIENNLGDEGLKVKITMLQTKSIPVEFDTSLIGTAISFQRNQYPAGKHSDRRHRGATGNGGFY